MGLVDLQDGSFSERSSASSAEDHIRETNHPLAFNQ